MAAFTTEELAGHFVGTNEHVGFPGDTIHYIYDLNLARGALLHHFKNAAGVPFSAIVINGFEHWNCVRYDESSMCSHWNEEFGENKADV